MPAPTADQWLESSLAVMVAAEDIQARARGMEEAGRPEYWRDVHGGLLSRLLATMPVPETWSRAVQDAVVAHFERHPYEGDRYVNERLRDVACLRIGHAAVTRDTSWVSAAEAAALERYGLLPSPSSLSLPPVDVGDSFIVEFATPFPLLPPKARTRTIPSRATGMIPVERVDPLDAPIKLSLGFPGGESIDARVHQGVTFRPLLAPGSYRRIGEAEFAHAARGDDAWGDNPFLSSGAALRSVPLREYARDLRPVTADGHAVMEDHVEVATETCGRLVSIDGFVYRETSEPLLYVTWFHDPRRYGVGLDWKMGDISSRFLPQPFTEADTHVDWSFGCRMSLSYRPVRGHAFAHGEVAAARDVLTFVAKELTLPVSTVTLAGDPSEPVDVLERMTGRLIALADCREGHPFTVFIKDVYAGPLASACTALRAGDLDFLRRVYRDWPQGEGNVMARAERAYLRAIVGVAGKALKGDYATRDDMDLDVSAFG